MEVFTPKADNDKLQRIVNPIGDSVLEAMVDLVFSVGKDDEDDTIYSKFYATRYRKSDDIVRKGEELKRELEEMSVRDSALIKTSSQNKEYEWVEINRKQMGETAIRFYLAPNPENMHEIARRLTRQFISGNVSVKFKYQQEGYLEEQCDRIIIYADSSNKQKVEEAMQAVYNSNPALFRGNERALPWLYQSKVEGVYVAPETPKDSYGKMFAGTIRSASDIFNYLYGITDAQPVITVDREAARNYCKKIIASLLLRNGLLMTKEGVRIIGKDSKILTQYDTKTGELINRNNGEQKYSEATFLPTEEGRKALLRNFYNVSEMVPQQGVVVRHMTIQERMAEINRKLYPDSNEGQTPGGGDGR